DAFANRFPGERAGPRYVIQQTVMVRSGKPDVVMAASQRVSELVGAGVVLSSSGEYGIGGPTFIFTRLNQLKPSMVKEATANARAAAEQFAADSRSDLGSIRQASQGIFVILPRDQARSQRGCSAPKNCPGSLHRAVLPAMSRQFGPAPGQLT